MFKYNWYFYLFCLIITQTHTISSVTVKCIEKKILYLKRKKKENL